MLSLRTSPFQRCIAWEGLAGGCRPWQGGWGSNDNDNDLRGDDDVDDVRLCPPHPHNNEPFGQGERWLFGRGEGGGVATVDANLQGQVGDAANEENIRTAAMEKEKEQVNARATRRTAVAGGGAGAKTKMTTTEAAEEGTAVAGGVDTRAATTMTTATMVAATTMTRLNVCDASTEEKKHPSNLLLMHATIKYMREQEQRG